MCAGCSEDAEHGGGDGLGCAGEHHAFAEDGGHGDEDAEVGAGASELFGDAGWGGFGEELGFGFFGPLAFDDFCGGVCGEVFCGGHHGDAECADDESEEGVHTQAEDADDDDGHTGGEDEQGVHGNGLWGVSVRAWGKVMLGGREKRVLSRVEIGYGERAFRTR